MNPNEDGWKLNDEEEAAWRLAHQATKHTGWEAPELAVGPCCGDPTPAFEPEGEKTILGWIFKLYCQACDKDLVKIIIQEKK